MAQKLLMGGLERGRSWGIRIVTGNPTFRAYEAQFKKITSLARPALPWAVPGVVVLGWMIFPALTDNFRGELGLPKKKDTIPSQAKYEESEVDQMPVKK